MISENWVYLTLTKTSVLFPQLGITFFLGIGLCLWERLHVGLVIKGINDYQILAMLKDLIQDKNTYCGRMRE